jgi:uncharacterized protein involved in exopolysaccharide biosynthesis
MDAERNLTTLRLRYTEEHPDVKMQEAIVAQLKAAPKSGTGASSTGGSIANPAYEQLKSRVLDLETRIVSTQRRLKEAIADRDRLENIARGAPGLDAQFTNLDRDYNVIRRNYEELLARRESMRIAAAAQADAGDVHMEVIDPPVIPQAPAGPRRLLMMSGVLLAGLASSVALAVLLVRFDASFHTIDDLRGFGLPVIGGVSLLTYTRPRSRATSVASVAVTIVLLGCVYVGLLTHLNQIADRI